MARVCCGVRLFGLVLKLKAQEGMFKYLNVMRFDR